MPLMSDWIEDDEEPETLAGFLRSPASTQRPSFRSRPPTLTIRDGRYLPYFGTSGFPKGAALSSRALLGGRASSVFAGVFLGKKIWLSSRCRGRTSWRKYCALRLMAAFADVFSIAST